MTDVVYENDPRGSSTAQDADIPSKHDVQQIESQPIDTVLKGGVGIGAIEAEQNEQNMSLLAALREYPRAVFWSFIMQFCIIFESYGYGLVGAFCALPSFQQRFGVNTADGWVIPTSWQTALTQASSIGAFAGITLAGPISQRIGYRWTSIIGLVAFIAFNFLNFFGTSLGMLMAGQVLCGIPYGFFNAVALAYASEVVPIALRGATTAFTMMCWVLGGIVSSPLLYRLESRTDEWAFRIPFAINWVFPVPLIILLFFAPESPWWLARQGKLDEAERAIARLGSRTQNVGDTLAMIMRTTEIERAVTSGATFFDLFEGVDRRRTLILSFIYAAQNWAGNLISNQSIFFFEQAGVSVKMAFMLGIISACLQIIAVASSWVQGTIAGRRKLYLIGTAINIGLCLILGIVACLPRTHATSYAQAALGMCITLVMSGVIGPVSFTIIAETSSVRLRGLSTAFGRGMYYVANFPTIFLSSQMLNPTGWHMGGKCGFVWAGTAALVWLFAYFRLPEMRNRSYREIDILFHRHTPARRFKTTMIEEVDDL